LADDTQDADGVSVLDYAQAQKAARDWWRSELRQEEGHDPRSGPFTVADAVEDYLKVFERRGGKSIYDSRRTAETHILPRLGTLQVDKLTSKRIEDWHHGLGQRFSFHGLRHTHGSMLAMRAVPMAVIAEQLGHTGTRMTEKHYAHLAPNFVADTIRAHFPTLGIAGDTNVIAMKAKKRPARQPERR
jgi:integrase